MHCRWAVTLRPRGPEQLGQLLGRLHTHRLYHQRLFVQQSLSNHGPAAGDRPSGPQGPVAAGRIRRATADVACCRPVPGRTRRRGRRPRRPVRPGRGPAAAGRRAVRRAGHRGGITGAGVALDAASRGLRTALVEKDDFASGTSSKSSKMVHGGLRYLQQREFRLVYENLAERQRLLENAPHLVSPLPFLIPLFGRDGVVNQERGPRPTDRPVALRPDRWHAHRQPSRAGDPGRGAGPYAHPRTDRLVAGFLYYDARADDARLTLTVLRTAALDHGAVAANSPAVDRLLTDAGPVRGRVDRRPRAGARGGRRPVRRPGRGGGQRRRGVGRRGPGPRRRARTPTRCGRPRAST